MASSIAPKYNLGLGLKTEISFKTIYQHFHGLSKLATSLSKAYDPAIDTKHRYYRWIVRFTATLS